MLGMRRIPPLINQTVSNITRKISSRPVGQFLPTELTAIALVGAGTIVTIGCVSFQTARSISNAYVYNHK